MRKLTTAACALALGLAWVAAPAFAQDTTKDKAERKAQQIEQKGQQKADETKAKAEEKADRVRDNAADKTDSVGNKAERAWDKTKAKTEETWDKTKAKTRDMTDKAKDKVSGKHDGMSASDMRSAQQALKEKGFDPGPIDGKGGPRTTAAIKEFQQKENLPATGTLDRETRTHLMASAPAASPSTMPAPKR